MSLPTSGSIYFTSGTSEPVVAVESTLLTSPTFIPRTTLRKSGDACAKVLDFFGMMQMPAVVFLQLCIKHSVHHRGQLSAYLRPMGGKVPSIYGPSADENPLA